jgi:hypothetical protein
MPAHAMANSISKHKKIKVVTFYDEKISDGTNVTTKSFEKRFLSSKNLDGGLKQLSPLPFSCKHLETCLPFVGSPLPLVRGLTGWSDWGRGGQISLVGMIIFRNGGKTRPSLCIE